MLYDGDMHQYDKVLSWLTSQDVFEIKNEIEEVNRKMLDKLLEENEFLTVFFCEYSNVTQIHSYLVQTKTKNSKLSPPSLAQKAQFTFSFPSSSSSRNGSRRECDSFGEAGKHRQRNRQLRHHIREDGRFAICAKMGRYQAASVGLLQKTIPQYL
jgi:hypothetical protein